MDEKIAPIVLRTAIPTVFRSRSGKFIWFHAWV